VKVSFVKFVTFKGFILNRLYLVVFKKYNLYKRGFDWKIICKTQKIGQTFLSVKMIKDGDFEIVLIISRKIQNFVE
jgi:hypothetical protein